jgi:hypothetical protein
VPDFSVTAGLQQFPDLHLQNPVSVRNALVLPAVFQPGFNTKATLIYSSVRS